MDFIRNVLKLQFHRFKHNLKENVLQEHTKVCVLENLTNENGTEFVKITHYIYTYKYKMQQKLLEFENETKFPSDLL